MTNDTSYTRLVICVNLRTGDLIPSCGAKGSRDIADLLESGLITQNIPLKLEKLHCMGKCHIGPTLRLAPAGPFIMGIDVKDVPHILEMLKAQKFDELASEFPLAEMNEFD